MKSLFKPVSFILTIILFLTSFTFSVSAASINVDGEISTREWGDAKTTTIFSNASQSANNISFAEMKAVKSDANTLYLAFSATDPVPEDLIDDCAMNLTIADFGTYSFTTDNQNIHENNNNLEINAQASGDLERHFFFEFKITFKKSIPANIQLKVQFKDGAEVLSTEVTLTDFIDSTIVPAVDNPTTTKKSQTQSTKKHASTKFSADKGTTKFSADKSESENNSSTKPETSTVVTSVISSTNGLSAPGSETIRIVLSVLAILLVLGACALLVFARPKNKQDDSQDEKNKENDSKTTKD